MAGLFCAAPIAFFLLRVRSSLRSCWSCIVRTRKFAQALKIKQSSMTFGSVEKVLVLSVVMYKWGGHERSWTCAVYPCGVGSEPGSCACLQSSFFSAAFHSAAVVSDFMFDALRGLDVSRGGSSSGRAW